MRKEGGSVLLPYSISLFHFSNGSLLSLPQQAEAVLARNQESAVYGLQLSPAQAEALILSQQQSLKRAGRIEFDCGILPNLISAFCSSPYLLQEEYESTLQALTALFYHFKTETGDRLSDQTLLSYMRKAFNGPCHGSLELLSSTALPALVRRLQSSGPHLTEREQNDD